MTPRLLLSLSLLLAAAPAWAQNVAFNADDELDEVLTIESDELVTIQTEVNVVTIPVVVRGPKGVYVDGLEKQDFELYDNGKKQSITGFDVSFQPISMVVCFQTSDRVEGMIDQIQKTAVLFTDAVLGEFGEAAILQFDSRIKRLTDFTGDTETIDRAFNSFKIGSGGIRVSDCVYEGIRMLTKRPQNHKRVVTVIAEGQDNGSTIDLGETLRTAQIYNIQVYPIYLSTLKARLRNTPEPPRSVYPPGISPLPVPPGSANTPTTQQQARWSATPNMIPLIIDLVVGVKNLIFRDALAVLARGTGADDYKPMSDEGLQEAIVKIGQDLRSQYVLSYTPNNLADSGIFHEVEVKVPYYGNAKVRARPGYFYGPRPQPAGGDPEIIE